MMFELDDVALDRIDKPESCVLEQCWIHTLFLANIANSAKLKAAKTRHC